MEPLAGWLNSKPAKWTKDNWIFHNYVNSTLVEQWPGVMFLGYFFLLFGTLMGTYLVLFFCRPSNPYASVAIPTHSAVDLRASWLAPDLVKEVGLKSTRRRTRRRGTRSDEAFALVQYRFKTIWPDGVCKTGHVCWYIMLMVAIVHNWPIIIMWSCGAQHSFNHHFNTQTHTEERYNWSCGERHSYECQRSISREVFEEVTFDTDDTMSGTTKLSL